MATNSSEDKSRPSSNEDRLNTPPKLLLRRNKQRSTKKKRSTSPKLTKDEIRYQRFVQDLKRDIQVQMKQYMQEDRFSTRDYQAAKTDSSIRLLQTAIKSKQVSSTIISHRTNDIETVTTSLSQRQDPLSFLKQNEKKRLAADVRRIITGPGMKQFYTQFIRPLPPIYRQQTPIPFEESILHISEQ